MTLFILSGLVFLYLFCHSSILNNSSFFLSKTKPKFTIKIVKNDKYKNLYSDNNVFFILMHREILGIKFTTYHYTNGDCSSLPHVKTLFVNKECVVNKIKELNESVSSKNSFFLNLI
jgi:hypothetical protein